MRDMGVGTSCRSSRRGRRRSVDLPPWNVIRHELSSQLRTGYIVLTRHPVFRRSLDGLRNQLPDGLYPAPGRRSIARGAFGDAGGPGRGAETGRRSPAGGHTVGSRPASTTSPPFRATAWRATTPVSHVRGRSASDRERPDSGSPAGRAVSGHGRAPFVTAAAGTASTVAWWGFDGGSGRPARAFRRKREVSGDTWRAESPPFGGERGSRRSVAVTVEVDLAGDVVPEVHLALVGRRVEDEPGVRDGVVL